MARTTNDAKATFTEVFDMVAPLFTGTPYLGADVGLQAAAAIKLYFREHFGAFVRTESICTEEVENRGTKGSLGLSAARRLPSSNGGHRPRPPSLASKSGKVNSLRASLSPLQFDPAAYFNQRARGYLEPVDGVCRIARHE
jgi:hypothetical protein